MLIGTPKGALGESRDFSGGMEGLFYWYLSYDVWVQKGGDLSRQGGWLGLGGVGWSGGKGCRGEGEGEARKGKFGAVGGLHTYVYLNIYISIYVYAYIHTHIHIHVSTIKTRL